MSTTKKTWWAIVDRCDRMLTTDLPPGATESHVNVPWLFATRAMAERYVEPKDGERAIQVVVKEIEDAP